MRGIWTWWSESDSPETTGSVESYRRMSRRSCIAGELRILGQCVSLASPMNSATVVSVLWRDVAAVACLALIEERGKGWLCVIGVKSLHDTG
jgi:hypothetical protein